MPAPPPTTPTLGGSIKGVSPGAMKFLKSNAAFAYGGGIGLAFLAGDVKNILDADNKLKALLKTAKDFILIRVAMIGIFKGVSDVIKGLVRDTGSLDAALKRLTQVQQYARQFQSFTGSLESAKQKIAELHQLSLRGVFKFEDLVEANKSLQTFTRGAYTSVEATKTVGEAAVATGNSIQDTARAVGNFYDTLRAGGPVGSAAEQLRQMGLISGATADQITSMAESGSSAKSVFDELTSALEKAAQGTAGYKDELQGVTAEHEKAAEELKVAFGAPFTDTEIQKTKNMTDALKSITPVVAELSKAFAFLFNSGGMLVSSLLKLAAGSRTVQKALSFVGEAIAALSVAAGAFGLAVMAPLIVLLYRFSIAAGQEAFVAISRLTGAMGAAAIAGRVLSAVMATLLIGSVILMAVTFVTAMVGAMKEASEAAKRAQKDFQDWTKSLRDSTQAILEQAAAVTTLASKYEALGKTLQKMSENQKELKGLRKEEARLNKQIQEWEEGGVPGQPKKLLQQREIVRGKIAEIERQQKRLEQSREEQTTRQPLHEQLIRQEADRQYFHEQQMKSAKQRDQEAKAGVKVAAQAETDKSQIVADRMKKEKDIADKQAVFESHRGRVNIDDIIKHYNQQKDAQEEVNQLKKQEQEIGLAAPAYTATYKVAREEQLRKAKEATELEVTMKTKDYTDVEDKLADEARLRQARVLAGPEAIEEYKRDPAALTRAIMEAQKATKREAEPPSPEELRQANVQALQIDTELKGKAARRHGDVAGAQAAEDLSSAMQHFEALIPTMGANAEAAKVALAQTQEDIAQQYVPGSQITSSLAAVGGGGEVSKIDPELDSAHRREQIQSEMLSVLKILAGQEPEQPAQPTFTK